MALQDPNIMPSSRLDCPLSLKTPNMGNTGSMRFHPIGGGPKDELAGDLKTTKTDKKHGSRRE